MHGLEHLLLYVLLACFGMAFFIELSINRRPFVVAVAVPLGGWLAFLLIQSVLSDVDGATATLFAVIFGFGMLASLAGAGGARAIRQWIEFIREQRRSDR